MANGDWPPAWPWPQSGQSASPFAVRQPAMLGGWACPNCLRCLSPAVTECPHCQPGSFDLGAGYTDFFAEAQSATFEAGSRAAAEEMENGTGRPCAPAREGGMCGCGEDDDEPRRTCRRARCDC